MSQNKEAKKNHRSKVYMAVHFTALLLLIALITYCILVTSRTFSDVDTAVLSSTFDSSIFSDTLTQEEGSYRVKSEISSYVCDYVVPDDFDVTYSDDYSVEFVEHFDDIDEEEEENYELYKSHYYVSFMNVRNTPYAGSDNFIKAHLMNQGYDNIYDFTQDGKYYIVAWTPLNVDSNEEHAYHTAINVLCLIDNNVECPYEENCYHTDYVQQYISTGDTLDKEGVEDLVTYIIGDYKVGK